jgi:hypothetical protein
MTTTLNILEQIELPALEPLYDYDDALVDGIGYVANNYPGQPSRSNNTALLWESGCQAGDFWNCTAACLDLERGPTLMRNSVNATNTLQNCIVYPIIAVALASGSLSGDGLTLAQKYNIQPMSNVSLSDPAQIWPVFHGCISTYCNTFASGTCLDGFGHVTQWDYALPNLNMSVVRLTYNSDVMKNHTYQSLCRRIRPA